MTFLEIGEQPRDARAQVQARRWRLPLRSIVLASLAAVSACANRHTSGPEAWWHASVGGKIAEQRPPPPGDKDPFPNLATIPPKPAPVDVTWWNRTTAGLVTDRTRATEAAALTPIPPAFSGSPASATSGLPQGPAPSPATDQGASAALVGVTAAPIAPRRAPSAVKPPETATGGAPPKPGVAPIANPRVANPLAPTVAGQPAAPSAVPPPPIAPASISVADQAARVATGALPALPTQEPARPNIAPGRPPPAVPVTATPPVPAARVGTDVDFERRSATLNDAALADVKAIAAARGDHGVAVTGYGDASSSDALGQSDALDLGLRRAQALATALAAQGVPVASLRVNAEAAGRGASLRLLQ